MDLVGGAEGMTVERGDAVATLQKKGGVESLGSLLENVEGMTLAVDKSRESRGNANLQGLEVGIVAVEAATDAVYHCLIESLKFVFLFALNK